MDGPDLNRPDDQPKGPPGSNPDLPERVTACVAAVERHVASLRGLHGSRDHEELVELTQELREVVQHRGSADLTMHLKALEEALAEEADIAEVSERLEALILLCRRGNGEPTNPDQTI